MKHPIITCFLTMALTLTMPFQQGSAKADSYNEDAEFETEMSEFLRPPDELDTNLDPDSQPDILNQPDITDQPDKNTAGDVFRESAQKAKGSSGLSDEKNENTDFVYPKNLMSPN